jgi:Family of unknown function (DUF5681)
MAKSTSGFKPGSSGNPNGRPKGAATRKVSSLRGIFNKLKKMDTEAIDTIQKSLTEGSVVDKDKVQTAKWVITTITQLHKACLSEEEGKSSKDTEDTPPEIEDGDVDRSSKANIFSISMSDK